MYEFLIQRYLGNKASMAEPIVAAMQKTCPETGVVIDAFSGSLGTAAAFREAGYRTVLNDVNLFSWVFGKAFFATDGMPAPVWERSTKDEASIEQWRDLIDWIVNPANAAPEALRRQDFFQHYCSDGDRSEFLSARGRSGRRNFFSAHNGSQIDRILSLLRFWWRDERIDERTLCILLSVLMVGVEKISNTQGTFHDFPRGFIDPRAQKELVLKKPQAAWFSGPEAVCIGKARDSIEFLSEAPSGQWLYLDPPYNFRQYTAYYFMLNLISRYVFIDDLDEYFDKIEFVRGQNMSDDFSSSFCSKKTFVDSLKTVIERANCDYVAMSYYDGPNHWGSFKSEVAETEGYRVLSSLFKSDMFDAGSFEFTPIDRTNYQSYGGHKAKRIREFLFIAKRSIQSKLVAGKDAVSWTGKAQEQIAS